MSNYINRQLFVGTVGCPRCGHTKVQSRGIHRAITRTYRRFQCQNPKCMGWFRLQNCDKESTPAHRIL
jgi:hypothetical protein